MSSHKFWIILTTTALIIAGCADKTPTVTKIPVQTVEATTIDVPQQVHKKGVLTEVQDGNFSSAYMYPEEKVTKEKVVKVATTESTESTETTASVMSKEECVGMIGQDKFDKYAQMFGSETSSIKRCAMLKAMN